MITLKKSYINNSKETFSIDEDILDIFQMICETNYSVTDGSCQDEDNKISIDFFDFEDIRAIRRRSQRIFSETGDNDNLKNFIDNECSIILIPDDDLYDHFLGENVYKYDTRAYFSSSLYFDKSKKNKFIELWNKLFNKST